MRRGSIDPKRLLRDERMEDVDSHGLVLNYRFLRYGALRLWSE